MKRAALFLLVACGSPNVVSPPIVVRTHGATTSATAGPTPSVTPTTKIPDVDALVADADGAKRSLEIVRSVCDEVGARPAGGSTDTAAVEWGQRTMTALGFANVHAEPVKVPRWERGVESASIVNPPLPLAITQLGGSIPTPPNGLEAEVVRVNDLDDLAGLDANLVRGRIVFLANKMEATQDFEGYGHAVGSRVMGAIAAAKKGAIAVVVRSVGTDNNRLPHTGFVKMPEASDGVGPIPAAAISGPDADAIDRLYEAKKTVRMKLKLGGHKIADGTSANVVGDVVGREKPQEIVLLGAHLDSWDLGRGALDDGAGMGIVLAAARMVAQHKTPRRTVRVVLFAAEEMSAAGAKQYALDHQKEIEKHVAAMEADAGDGAPLKARWLGSIDGNEAAERLRQSMASIGLALEDGSAEGGTDVGPLRAAGVPVIDIAQDVTRYFDVHHSANDTFDKVDEESIRTATSAFAVATWTLAESPTDLGRVPLAKRTRSWGK